MSSIQDKTALIAREAWRRALDDLPDPVAEVGRLASSLEGPDVSYKGGKVCHAIEPRFLSGTTLDSLARTSATVVSALHKA